MEKVSIIIPAYNKADLTVLTVESVLSQTYKNIEVIVVDDGSQDDTAQKLRVFGQRIIYIKKENSGACSARNVGLNSASGEVIGFLDCDDIYLPEKVERGVDFFRAHARCGFLHTAAQFIDQNGAVVGSYNHPASRKAGWISRRLIFENYICNSTIMARKEVVLKAGGFNESIFMPGDWDLSLRMSEISQAGYIEEPLTQYRVSDNYILRRAGKAQEEEATVLADFFARNPGLRGWFQKRVNSAFHLRYALCYFLLENAGLFGKELRLSLIEDPFNLKAFCVQGGSWIAPNYLRKKIKRKILRGGSY